MMCKLILAAALVACASAAAHEAANTTAAADVAAAAAAAAAEPPVVWPAGQQVVAAAGERVALEVLGMPYHGTTALQELIKTARSATTLCGMRLPSAEGRPGMGTYVWQCEATKVLVEAQTLNIVGRLGHKSTAPALLNAWQLLHGGTAVPKVKTSRSPLHVATPHAFPGLPCSAAWSRGTAKLQKAKAKAEAQAHRQSLSRGPATTAVDECIVTGTAGAREFFRGSTILPMTRRLEFFGRHWDLRRPVLACKWCALPTATVERLALPGSFAAAGITRLLPAAVIVWRPVCLRALSSHAFMAAPAPGALNNATDRLLLTRELLKDIEGLEHHAAAVDASHRRAAGARPAIAVSMATMLWEPAVAAAQLQAFLPQLRVDASGVPEREEGASTGGSLGSNSSRTKSFGSRTFGLEHPAAAVGYDLRARRCTWQGPEYGLLSLEHRLRLTRASEQLRRAAGGALSPPV